MSDDGPRGSIQEDEPELAAAEYVLGTLDAAEADGAVRRIARDAGFAAKVAAWERRLYPLAFLVRAVPLPEGLWARIEASTAALVTPATGAGADVAPAGGDIRASPAGGAIGIAPGGDIGVAPGGDIGAAPGGGGAANDNSAGFWRVTALASMAVAAGLAAFVVLRPPPRPPAQIVTEAVISRPVVAVLGPATGGAAVLVAVADAGGALAISPTGAITVPEGRDLELWSLAAGATRPASLGVLPATGKRVSGNLAVGTQLLVSLEPKGGSPTGQPTGPVLYAGKLATYE